MKPPPPRTSSTPACPSFEQEVLLKSKEVPVLVDFWATWCGPCKTLGPILEKLADEFNGGFLLAKVDVDKEQQLAGYFQIKSVPTVMLVKDGQIVDGFPGALPEGQLREFLKHHGVEPAAAVEEAAPDVEGAAGPARGRGAPARRRAGRARQGRKQARPGAGPAQDRRGGRGRSACSTPCPPTWRRTTARCAAGRAWASPRCSRTRRPRRCWKPPSPPIRPTCAHATCWART